MSDFDINRDYLSQEESSSTVSTSETEVQPTKTEVIEHNISKMAVKAIDKKYRANSGNTSTDDIKTYSLSKPKRVTITGILKND